MTPLKQAPTACGQVCGEKKKKGAHLQAVHMKELTIKSDVAELLAEG